MTAPDRRSFMAATAASIATPVGLGAKECPTAGMDWITMSLEAPSGPASVDPLGGSSRGMYSNTASSPK